MFVAFPVYDLAFVSYHAVQMQTQNCKLLKQIEGFGGLQVSAFKNGILKTKTENEGVLLKGIDKNYDFAFRFKLL